jgi:hypothetical protein
MAHPRSDDAPDRRAMRHPLGVIPRIAGGVGRTLTSRFRAAIDHTGVMDERWYRVHVDGAAAPGGLEG